MIWIAIGALVLVALVVVVALAQSRDEQPSPDQLDPLFPAGVALTGAGVALGVTTGPFMFAMMAAGLIMMAVGARRSRG